MMDREEFDRLIADGYNRIPLARTVLADVETPLSAYRKLAAGPYSFLFESVQGGEKWGRYSIIGLPASKCYSISGNAVSLLSHGEVVDEFTVDDPLAYVENLHSEFAVAPVEGLPVFHGGLVGYFGYDVVRYVEPKLRHSTPEKSLHTPDILLMLSEEVLVFDNLAGTLTLIITAEANVGGEVASIRPAAGVDQLKC